MNLSISCYRTQMKFAKVMLLHVSVCLQGGWYPSMPCRSPGPHQGGRGDLQAHTQGGRLRGLAREVSRPTPGGKLRGLVGVGLQAHTKRGCIPACTEADKPPSPSRRLLVRAVRILLECILGYR